MQSTKKLSEANIKYSLKVWMTTAFLGSIMMAVYDSRTMSDQLGVVLLWEMMIVSGLCCYFLIGTAVYTLLLAIPRIADLNVAKRRIILSTSGIVVLIALGLIAFSSSDLNRYRLPELMVYSSVLTLCSWCYKLPQQVHSEPAQQ
jgi:hypothetical protein